MAKVSLHQAGCNAFATALGALISSGIEPRWPDPNKALAISPGVVAVTIIPAGQRQIEFFEPVVVDKGALVGHNRTYTYSVAEMRLPIQIDITAVNDIDRDDIIARIDDALQSPDIDGDITHGITFALGDGWSGYGVAWVDQLMLNEEADELQQQSYRATYTGQLYAMPTIQATQPSIARVRLRAQVHEQSSYPTGQPVNLRIITSTTVSDTEI